MNKIFQTLLSASFVLALTGCGGSSSHESSRTSFRVVHASPDAPNVDVLVGGATVFANVPYFESGTEEINPGPTQIRVRATGTTTEVINVTPNLAASRLYTVLAVNTLANIEPLVINDPDFGPGAGQARVRLVHGSPSTGNVDIYVTSPTATLPATPTLANIPFKAVSDPLTVPSGNYRVRITPAGTPGTIAIDTGSLTLGSNTSTIAVALDKAGGGSPLTARVYSTSY